MTEQVTSFTINASPGTQVKYYAIANSAVPIKTLIAAVGVDKEFTGRGENAPVAGSSGHFAIGADGTKWMVVKFTTANPNMKIKLFRGGSDTMHSVTVHCEDANDADWNDMIVVFYWTTR